MKQLCHDTAIAYILLCKFSHGYHNQAQFD